MQSPTHFGHGTPAAQPAAQDNGDVDYHYLMWLAERDAGNAPIGSPPREEPTPMATPCGCPDCDQQDNGNGELVCRNCGVVCGRLVHGRDSALRLTNSQRP